MKARLQRKLKKSGRLPEKKVSQWKDYFPFERFLIGDYETIKKINPSHHLLVEGDIEPTGHFKFSSERWNILKDNSVYFKINPVPIANQEYSSVKGYAIKLAIEARKLKRDLTEKLNLSPYSEGEK